MAAEREAVNAKVSIKIEATIVVDNSGYLDTQASVADHMHRARSDLASWQFLVKQGGSEPKPIQAVATVSHVTLIPKVAK